MLVAAPAAFWVTSRILTRARLLDDAQSWILAPFVCAVWLLLPEDVFAEREHIAVIAILPLLAVYAARASGKSFEGWTRIIAGAGAGLAVVVKPYFALALILPFFYAASVLRRRPKELFALIFSREHLLIVLIAAAYAASLAMWFREYLEVMLPMAQHAYLPVRFPWPLLIAKPTVILPVVGFATVAAITTPGALKPLPLLMALAAVGFWLASLIEGKGWPYHGYPAVALVLIASLIVAIERWPRQRSAVWRATTLGLVGGLCVLSAVSFRPAAWYPEFVATIARVAPEHPRLMAICGARLEYLWPISRIVHGEAIGHGLWVNEVVNALENWGEVDRNERLIVDRYARDERMSFVAALRTQRPNVLIVCNDGWKGWALARPEFAAEMRKYHRTDQVERAEIWLPN